LVRTTVTLDPDVAAKLKELAHRRRTSFKQTLNDVVRRGLAAPEVREHGQHFNVAPHEGGFRPGVDLDKLNQLVDQLEVEDFVGEAGHRE
jgi:hypothetical protein